MLIVLIIKLKQREVIAELYDLSNDFIFHSIDFVLLQTFGSKEYVFFLVNYILYILFIIMFKATYVIKGRSFLLYGFHCFENVSNAKADVTIITENQKLSS